VIGIDCWDFIREMAYSLKSLHAQEPELKTETNVRLYELVENSDSGQACNIALNNACLMNQPDA
jgi:hypothetical protein